MNRAELSAISPHIEDSEIERLIAPYVERRFPLSDPTWRDGIRALSASLGTTRRRQLLARLLGRGARRTRRSVSEGYDRIWSTRTTAEPFLHKEGATTLAFWREEGFVMHPNALKRIHQLILFRCIGASSAQTILEVGCGAGHQVMPLACRYPERRFTGLDLSRIGISQAQDLRRVDSLPPSFADFAPEPLVDTAAHRDVELVQGDATRLPFADGSFDLVYTSLALEQMNPVRDAVFAEIARVARQGAIFVEPWRDFNERGVQRKYVSVKGYFQARARDLEGFGFRVSAFDGDIPAKAQMRVSTVIAEKADAPASGAAANAGMAAAG